MKAYRVEIKYTVITLVSLAMLILLDTVDAFSGLDSAVDSFMDSLTSLGFIGMFFVALVGNASLLIQIPYTVPLLSVVLNGTSFENLMLWGLSAGIGAGFGEIISYGIADKLWEMNPDIANSKLYQWVDRTVKRYPKFAPIIIFIWAASILPDDTALIPLAMIKYGMKKIALPLFLGKIAHNIVLVVLLYYATEEMSDYIGTGVKTDLALGVLIIFVMTILYQVEKNKTNNNQSVPATN